jgi:multidrug efflux pump subunit AcrB
VGDLVVGVSGASPVYLRQIADIQDGPEEPAHYVTFGHGGAAGPQAAAGDHPAVTIAVAKTKGADAMRLADAILAKVERLQPSLIPSDIEVEVTRNYGETASDKVSELLLHLLGSIVAVTIVVTLSMGLRGGLVVFLSVPVTFALTLLVYYLLGYTLNRITLFALVFVTGIVVDDSIIIAENMHRHFRMRRLPFKQAALASIDEVGNPTILATFTVISAVLPMVFVSGLMGPYMSPMPIGASFAMIFSLLVALIITPFLAYHLLKGDKSLDQETGDAPKRIEDTSIYKLYARLMNPLLASSGKRWAFIGIVVVLLLGSVSLLYFRLLEVKMLPFDNKNEFQIIVDMPEGTPLEKTYTVSKEIAAYLQERPEVVDYQAYTGLPAPINFNGLVRHYDLRSRAHMADIQVNLRPKDERADQSHAIAKRLRPDIQQIASHYGANVKVVEVPPGPPVMSTLVAEVYGPDLEQSREVARQLKGMFEAKEGVVDVDWRVEAPQTEYEFSVDKEKAMLNGITTAQVVEALNMALDGRKVGRLYRPEEVEEVDIQLRLEEQDRSAIEGLKGVRLRNAEGKLVPLGDVTSVRKTQQERSIHHKNQQRVTYVTADVAGAIESPVYAILDFSERLDEIEVPAGYRLHEYYTQQPFTEETYSLKWDGEWHITYEVFRDLGGAFAVVLVVIYMLIIGWFQDFKVPLVMMVAIPLSLVGILPGHWALGAFFTATSMIGMIALAGIMVRNSVLLIDFIQLQLKGGSSLRDAVLEAGAVRTTPILLTAGTVVIGAFVILFDPIFQGLAISLMGGSIASTVLTLLIVPLIYFMTEKGKYGVDTPDPMGIQQAQRTVAGSGEQASGPASASDAEASVSSSSSSSSDNN